MLSRRVFLAVPGAAALRAQEQKGNMFGDAEAYERFMGRWSRLAAPLLVDFAGVRDTGHALDVGSGTGALAFAAAERKKQLRVTGIDPSKEYVAYAADRNRFGKRVTFEVGDAQQLHFGSGAFDASFSLLVFNFIPDASKALHEVRRVTRPGGTVSAAVWDYGAGMRMLRVFWDAAASLDTRAEALDEKHMKLCRAGELADLWKRGGLEQVVEQPLDITMRFGSFADYWDPFLLGQGPAGAYVGKLDGDRVPSLREEVKRRLSVAAEGRVLRIAGAGMGGARRGAEALKIVRLPACGTSAAAMPLSEAF